ncbi:MAG: MAPEG family protein [Actinomycetota bacterium]|nr:MAPEG family protein [Actinomycetota bacterium]
MAQQTAPSAAEATTQSESSRLAGILTWMSQNGIFIFTAILILFALIELAAGASLWLWIGALAYVLARVAHAFGMDADRPTAWRAGGAIVTWTIMVVLAGAALAIAYGQTREMPVPPALAAQV